MSLKTIMAVIALSATAATAQAETAQMRVHVGDLNLTTEAGAQRALFRIKIAAREFCAPPLEILNTPSADRCRRELIAKAVRQLDAPMVTALWFPPDAVEVAQH